MLQQNGHPIAFVSKALGPRNQALSIYEKEYLAILMAIDHWRQYLITNEFIILTDQQSLVHLDDQKLSTPWQHKALIKMLGLQYKSKETSQRGTYHFAVHELEQKAQSHKSRRISQSFPQCTSTLGNISLSSC